MSFLMIVSLAYVTIETIDPEPAYASGEFACFNNDGRAYAYQSVWDSDHLDVYRWQASTGQTDGNDGNTTVVATFTHSDFSPYNGSNGSNISEVNSFMMDRDGNAYALLKQTDDIR